MQACLLCTSKCVNSDLDNPGGLDLSWNCLDGESRSGHNWKSVKKFEFLDFFKKFVSTVEISQSLSHSTVETPKLRFKAVTI